MNLIANVGRFASCGTFARHCVSGILLSEQSTGFMPPKAVDPSYAPLWDFSDVIWKFATSNRIRTGKGRNLESGRLICGLATIESENMFVRQWLTELPSHVEHLPHLYNGPSIARVLILSEQPENHRYWTLSFVEAAQSRKGLAHTRICQSPWITVSSPLLQLRIWKEQGIDPSPQLFLSQVVIH